MNKIAKLIYETTSISNGTSNINTTTKDVFCEINNIKLEEQSSLASYGLTSSSKCLINTAHDSETLTKVIVDNTTYDIEAKDRYKCSDQINLYLKERKK